ncbi:MAG TPA: PTS fructose transporter subunit IIA [Polyangia bacterium]|nr:PTS fructose transporter subunit IIA [Polyangia bacterium]
MKTGVIIVTHGAAAESMVDAAERMVGGLDVKTVSVQFGEPRLETEQHLEAAVEALGTTDVLFLVDLEGSTPFNLCCRRCGGSAVVLSGMNLPMLFKLATADRLHGAGALAEELAATAIKSIHIRRSGEPR